jgi:hypothetical protein
LAYIPPVQELIVATEKKVTEAFGKEPNSCYEGRFDAAYCLLSENSIETSIDRI